MDIIRMKDLTKKLQRSRSQIYQDISAGEFPPGIKLGKRARGWKVQEIEAWLNSRKAA